MANTGRCSQSSAGCEGAWSSQIRSASSANAASYAGQIVGMALGVQEEFSWKGVAATALNTAANYALGSVMGGDNPMPEDSGSADPDIGVPPPARGTTPTPEPRPDFSTNFLRNMVAGTVGGVVRQLVYGGKPQWSAIAADAFGNALGNSIVGAMGSNTNSQQEARLSTALNESESFGQCKAPVGWDIEGGDRLSAKDLEQARILKERDTPFRVDDNGGLHYFSTDRNGSLVTRDGSRVNSYVRDDNVTVREHWFGDTLLGKDYGVPEAYRYGQPDDVGGDPVSSVRRQVAVSPEHAEWAKQYIDAGSGQVDPAKWDDFLSVAQQQGLRMTVTSNGIVNPHQQAMDNPRAIAAGYKDSLTINVYNPTGGFWSDVVEAAAGVFGRTQSVQVAIQNQVADAQKFNEQMIVAQEKLGVTVEPFQTLVIGHSQGSINVNAAVGRMNGEQQDNVRLINIGTYAPWGPAQGVGNYVNILDQHDGARFASGWMANDPNYQDNPRRQIIWTDFNKDGQGEIGNNHSLYLYLQRNEVRQSLGMVRRPELLTQPFASEPH